MTDLDAALRDLAAHVAFPDPPDVAAAVRLRITVAPPAAAPDRDPADRALSFPLRRHPRARRWLAVAAAVLVVAAAATAAVPRARHAVADKLGLRGVEVHVVPTTTGGAPTGPSPTAAAGLELGRPTTLAEAAAGFRPPPLLVPPEDPTGVFVDDRTGEVSLTFADGRLLGQFPNAVALYEKLVRSGDETVAVTVDGERGIWLPGATHVLIHLGGRGDVEETQSRLAGRTLLWEHGDTTLRLEGASDLDTALAFAASLHPYPG